MKTNKNNVVVWLLLSQPVHVTFLSSTILPGSKHFDTYWGRLWRFLQQSLTLFLQGGSWLRWGNDGEEGCRRLQRVVVGHSSVGARVLWKPRSRWVGWWHCARCCTKYRVVPGSNAIMSLVEISLRAWYTYNVFFKPEERVLVEDRTRG